MNKKSRIVVLGDVLYDCFVWADRLPKMGETVTGYNNGFFTGGKGANQAVQAAKLGAEVYFIGKVGTDEIGTTLLNALEGYGVNVDYVTRDKEVPTGTCCIHVDSKGNNAIIVAPMANSRVKTEEIEKARELIESADVFITQLQLNEDAIEFALETAYNAGVTTVFNPAPAREVPEEFYAWSTYLTPNETEAEFFTQCCLSDMPEEDWYKAISTKFIDLGAKNLIVTLGCKGALYSNKDSQFIVPAFTVDAIDSTGAGDAFNAAFALKISQGASIKEAISFGNAAGSLTTTRRGAQPAMPTLDEINSFLSSRMRLPE